MNIQQIALIKKDIRSITSNKQVLMVMLIVPLALTIVLPSIFVFVTLLAPESTSDFQKLLEMLPVSAGGQNQEQMILWLMLNKIMPAFFLMIIAPAISLVAIAVTVRGSAKAQTIEEAQQCAVFLIFPILALVIGQFSGVMLVNSWLLLGLGIVLAVLDILLMRGAARKFTYEKLLK